MRTRGLVLPACFLTLLSVSLLVQAEDPDFGNDPGQAQAIATDNTEIFGELTAGDLDWFSFTPIAQSQYRLHTSNQNANWKLVRVYQQNEFGDLVEFYSYWQYSGESYRTFFMEYNRPCYIKLENDAGGYSVKVEYMSTTLPDIYSDECPQASEIMVSSPALTATLEHTDAITLDTDWFFFRTQPLHMYQIKLTTLDNCWSAFRLYAANCSTNITWDTTNYTITSWYGEDYKVQVIGDINRLGCLYTLEVIDLGAVTDDYGNTPEAGSDIATDGTEVFGSINYNTSAQSDVDWFHFVPTANSIYEFKFQNAVSNWKMVRIYQKNEFGDLVSILEWWCYNTAEFRTLFLEYNQDIYVKVENDGGDYSLTITKKETLANDTYGNACGEAMAIAANATAVIGTLDHDDEHALDNDWFTFPTQPLHQYRVQLSYLHNCWAAFRVYAADCATNINWDTTDFTVTSWYGEDYKLQVIGDANRRGIYYTLTVTDLGVFPDEFGNTFDVATEIATNGTEVPGVIDYMSTYHSDLDWLKFKPQAFGKFRVTFKNPEANWKMAHLYQVDELGNLIYLLEWWCYAASEARTFYLETDRECYLKIDSAGGEYLVAVENLEVVLPDSFTDVRTEAAAITPNGVPFVGTLNHRPEGYDEDWFKLPTQPLHQYQVQLSFLHNCSVITRIFDENGANIHWDNTNMTFVSWYGKPVYIQVLGDPAKLGNHYTLTVTDQGAVPDDYGNTWQDAFPIRKDGVFIEGAIQYSASIYSDEDWFSFIAGLDGVYQLSLHNPEYNWKLLRLYKANEVGQLVEYSNFWAYAGTPAVNWQLTAGQYYIRVGDAMGAYRVSVLSPEPRCGDLDHPYPPGDANQDCFVNIRDLALMAANWMKCTSPTPCQ